MKIDKAIEILELNVNQQGMQMPSDCLDAVKLGLEALKDIQDHRHNYPTSAIIPLPGEDAD